MTSLELFNSIEHSGIGEFISQQNHMVGAVAQLLHIIGLILVLSSVLIVSIRLTGYGPRTLTSAQLVATTSKLVWTGLGLLVISGLVMFVPAALLYHPNTFFRIKFLLLALALVVHVTLYRKVAQANRAGSALSRITAILSLSLWFGVAVAGRFIGFF